MAQADVASSEPPPPLQQASTPSGPQAFLRKLFGRHNGGSTATTMNDHHQAAEHRTGSPDPEKDTLIRRMSRRVVPGLPRAQTFKRQQSEQRVNLAPVEPTPDERRAVSVDRRSHDPRTSSTSQPYADPRISAPGDLGSPQDDAPQQTLHEPSVPENLVEDVPEETQLEHMPFGDEEVAVAVPDECAIQGNRSTVDAPSLTTSQYDAMIHDELEKIWILNLSMHFRDRSRREKFFVTYREQEHIWRRVTISLDYRNAPPNSLEMDLIHTHYQREKSAKIYEAIRESLRDIQFYDTVTNLKLQTTDGRLHVHVVEDGNEIISYPTVSQIKHLSCKRIREKDIRFDSHMSGFVYKVHVNGQILIKKEIPSPDTVDEFLYEVNALNRLRHSHNVIRFHGVVVDDHDEYVKGLLISYADQGALIDIIYENCKDGEYDIPWQTREKWARQIVEGLSDIHESGFVQGDFTLSNIVIDENDDAKIIDINRRGCPVGWEPPEATPLIECNQRISMYIGVKSDLYQLGMVLWALAMQEDEPEAQGRPLILGPEVNIPDWYRRMAEICLSDDPRMRLQASALLHMFPTQADREDRGRLNPPPMSVDEDYTLKQYLVDDYQLDNQPQIRTVEPPSDWSYVSRPYAEPSPGRYEPYYYTRGRSPPSPLPSNYDRCDSPGRLYGVAAWAANRDIPSSYSDVGPDDMSTDETPIANKPALIETNATLEADLAVGEMVENPLEESDARPSMESTMVGVDGCERSPDVTSVAPEPSGMKEVEAAEQPEVEYIMGPPAIDPITSRRVEVAGEEYTSRARQGAEGGIEAGKDYSSVRADSACDVVMPAIESLKEVETAKEAEPELLPTMVHTTQSKGIKETDDSTKPVHKLPLNVAEDKPATTPPSLGGQVFETQQLKLQPGHQINELEEQGTTAPEHHQNATGSSSRTVTPSKAHDMVCHKAITGQLDQNCKLGGIEDRDDEVSKRKDTAKAQGTDPLTGIGTVYLTNNEGDMIRQKKTIDEDLYVVESMPHDTITRMNAQTITDTA